jgi:hypothetical protein
MLEIRSQQHYLPGFQTDWNPFGDNKRIQKKKSFTESDGAFVICVARTDSLQFGRNQSCMTINRLAALSTFKLHTNIYDFITKFSAMLLNFFF